MILNGPSFFLIANTHILQVDNFQSNLFQYLGDLHKIYPMIGSEWSRYSRSDDEVEAE